MRSKRASRARWTLALALIAGACGKSRAPEPQPPAPVTTVEADAATRVHPAEDFGEKHLVFDDFDGGVPAPQAHREKLWGNYIDKQGHPAAGWHSHDPEIGNAQ